MGSITFSEKMTLAAGSTSLALVPGAGQAALVTVTPTAGSVQLSFSQAHNTIVPWDVDGTGLDEFHLKLHKNNHVGSGYFYGLSIIELNSHDNGVQLNGRGFVGVSAVSHYYGNTYTNPDEKIRVLANSFDVGQSLAYPYVFGLSNIDNHRRLIKYGTYNGSATQSGGEDTHTASGGLAGGGIHSIGFAFDPGDGLHYGWAEIELDFAAKAVEVLNWTYNDTAGDAVHVGTMFSPPPPPPVPQVPVPASIIPALTLLGLGAAGLRMQRRRKAKAAKAE